MSSSESPCRRICTLNKDEICTGCGRASKEIFKWYSMLESDKIEANQQARKRLKILKEQTK